MATTDRTDRITAKPAQNGAPTELIRAMLIDEHPLFRQDAGSRWNRRAIASSSPSRPRAAPGWSWPSKPRLTLS